jgi:hypothetical protein
MFPNPKLHSTTIQTNAFRSVSASVVAGSSDQGVSAETKGAQFSNATQIFYHPEYLRNTMINDIAIIRVSPAFNTSSKLGECSFERIASENIELQHTST